MKIHALLTAAAIFNCVSLFESAVLGQVPELINYQGRVAIGGTNFAGTGQFKFALVDGGTVTTPATATATASAAVINGNVVEIFVTDGGAGYASVPDVTIDDETGSGAQAIATVSAGVVTSITILNQGSDYSNTPTVTIAAPPPPSPVTVFNTFWSNDGTSTAGGEPVNSVSVEVSKGVYSILLGDSSTPNMNPVPATVFANPDVRLRIWFNDGIHGSQQLMPDQRIAAVGYAMVARSVDDGTITSAKLAPSSVTSTAISDSAITATKIAPGSITGESLTTGTSALSQSLGTSEHPWVTIAIAKSITPTGTTGHQTINKSSGSVNFASGAASLVVTDNLVDTNSVITATIATNDATADGLRIEKAAGSFTIYLKVAPTKETRIDFHVWN